MISKLFLLFQEIVNVRCGCRRQFGAERLRSIWEGLECVVEGEGCIRFY
jgi:hypothetical protein